MASTIRSCAVNVDGEPFPKAAQSAGMDVHELAPAGDAYLGLVPTVWYLARAAEYALCPRCPDRRTHPA